MRPWRSGGLVPATLLILSVLAAGCSGSSEPPPPAGPQSSADAGGDANQTAVGSLVGRVTNDESLPIPGVTVGLIELNLEVLTDSTGSFQFVNVPVGSYTMVAQRLGYHEFGRSVRVASGDATTVDVVLEAFVVVESYHESLSHRLKHVVSEVYVDFVVDQVAGQNNSCESCTWIFEFPKGPQNMVLEIFGEHQVDNPQGDGLYLYFFNHEDGSQIEGHGARPLPYYGVTKDKDVLEDAFSFRIHIYCDYYWVCVDEDREAWITAFYNQDAPEGFSAVPTE